MDQADAVDANDARIKPSSQPQGSVDILCEHASHQAVYTVVGALNDLCLCVKLVDDGDGAKDLVFVDGGIGGGVGKEGRLDEVALLLSAASPS